MRRVVSIELGWREKRAWLGLGSYLLLWSDKDDLGVVYF